MKKRGSYEYKMKGTIQRPTHLFRYPPNGRAPDYLGADGEWHTDARLLSYAQDDPLGADDISLAQARQVAATLGASGAVFSD
ncbi:MAG: hypothetical protein QOF21_42 [Actinomycetota bacterium]|jgi:hypothetical protein